VIAANSAELLTGSEEFNEGIPFKSIQHARRRSAGFELGTTANDGGDE
jgi:hypothetical protein